MNLPKTLRYTKTHEWAGRTGNTVRVGISDYAQKEISDIVFVELPKPSQACAQGKPIAVVESVKAAFDIYAPVSGTVKAVNKDLETNPALVNQSCYERGWFFEVELGQPAEWESLMTAEQYEKNLSQGDH